MQTSAPASIVNTSPTASGQRQAWVDNLRTFCVMLVVNMHACCTYSHVGGWYLTEGPDLPMEQKIPFYYWQGHMQAFFMGLLFFLGGHYAYAAFQRKGGPGFLKERFMRLMLPSLVFMCLIQPLIVVGINPYGIPKDRVLPWLGDYFLGLKFLGGTGPLWFAVALFFFCCGLVLWMRVSGSCAQGGPAKRAPGLGLLLGFGVLLSLGTFLVRTVQPMGTNILNFQLCYFFQYVLVFAVGCLACRQGWFERLAQGKSALVTAWLGFLGGPLFLTLLFVTMPISGNPPAHAGGWNFPALAFATWEQVSGLALGLGMMGLFLRFANKETQVTRWLSANSFGVYLLHAPVLVLLTLWFSGIQATPVAKTVLLTLAGLVVSYALSSLVRLVPLVRRIL